MHNSVPSKVAIQADIGPAVKLLTKTLVKKLFSINKNDEWWTKLQQESEKNKRMMLRASSDTSVPLNYYTVFKHIQDIIPKGRNKTINEQSITD